jgi:secondary thiamine-phosphate synthase enzyme
MDVITETIELSTNGNGEIADITDALKKALGKTSLSDGIVTVFVPGATGGLTTVEYEPGLVRDLDELWDRVAPADKVYHHNEAWHDGNGHSHVRASLLGPSITIPFKSGEPTLGTWQQVIFIDFDVRNRSRKIILQFMGK